MKFDTEGTYTLTYTATDSCGNSTSEERTVVVASPRTVLYTDGTFIINEDPKDRAANVAAHGEATNTYIPFDPNGSTNAEKYIFTATSRPWYRDKSSIKKVEVGSAISPFSTAYWFSDCDNLFSCELNNLNTENATDMRNMFTNCTALASLDLSSFNTSSVTNMGTMFAGCSALTSLNVSSFDTSSVTNMQSMFNRCSALTSLNVSSFNTSSVTNMSGMFEVCQALASLDLSSFNTSSVTNMNSMFSAGNYESLDLSSFNTSSVTNMSTMFNNNTKLTTIYVTSSFEIDQVTSSGAMFGSCRKLVGGAGTVFDSSHTNKEYARIDNPPDAPGYFTLKPSA